MVTSGPRFYCYALLILALIMAGISPACKFISGQVDFIEICGFDGIKMVAVDSSQTPDNTDHTKMVQDDCAFCFSHANVKAASAAPAILIDAPILVTLHDVPTGQSFTTHDTTALFEARGPPILL